MAEGIQGYATLVSLNGLPLPLPTKYHLTFGAPMRFSGRADDDDSELEKHVEVVKARLEAMLDVGLKERKAIFW